MNLVVGSWKLEVDDRTYPQRPIVGVGAVVLVSPGDGAGIGCREPEFPMGVVLVRRRFEPLAGQWSLPGGAVDVGETLEGAIARETLEETGLVVDVGPVIEVFDRILRDADGRVRYHFVLVDYLCRPAGGALRAGSDVSDACVANVEQLAEYALTAKAEEVIRRALNMT
jgi:ADP-ribose pyrophosphatase YjhB (NUDIX family)